MMRFVSISIGFTLVPRTKKTFLTAESDKRFKLMLSIIFTFYVYLLFLEMCLYSQFSLKQMEIDVMLSRKHKSSL